MSDRRIDNLPHCTVRHQDTVTVSAEGITTTAIYVGLTSYDHAFVQLSGTHQYATIPLDWIKGVVA